MYHKNLKKSLFLFMATIILPIYFGCGGSGTPNNGTKKIGKIDISDAKALMVSPKTSVIGSLSISNKSFSMNGSSPVRSSVSTNNVFVKVKSDGSIVEVNIYDIDGQSVSDKIPSAIYNATDAYIIIVMDNNPYLVNKVDGSAYDLSPVGIPSMLMTDTGLSGQTRKSIYNDSDGNIYYLNSGVVKKINVANPNHITAEDYTSNVDSIDEFAVDMNGNVLYSAYGVKRIKKANGGLYNMPDVGLRFYFTGYDGNIYFQDSNSDTLSIKKITVDPSYNISFSDYGSSLTGGFVYYAYQYNWVYFNDRLIMICDSSFEVYNPTGQPRKLSFEFLAYNRRKIIKNSSSYYYVATKQGSIIKVNPSDDSFTTLIPENEYDYYKMDVTNEDVVLFNALRMSDGKKVIGQVSSSGEVSIIDDTLVNDVVILQKVN